MIGRPLPGVRTVVLDSQDRSIPVRALGRLVVSGPCVARGHRGVLRTGMLARPLPDGGIQLLGDPADHVDLRGFRVETGRIEAALADYPGIAEVAVVSRGPSEAGTQPALVAYVVARPGAVVPTLAELRRWLWRKLPGYAWPSAMVEVDVVPRDEGGRVDEAALPPPGPFLASAWADVGGSERMGGDENYWQSFAFIDVLAEACRSGMPVPARHVTRNRTLETLATDVAASDATPGREADSN